MTSKIEQVAVAGCVLDDSEQQFVAGGQAAASYCVYGSNGTVGAHDFSSMTSRPLKAGETCGG